MQQKVSLIVREAKIVWKSFVKNYEQKEMILLTDEENKSYEKQKSATHVEKNCTDYYGDDNT